MTRTATQDSALLAPIESTLRRLIWRARAAIAIRGVLATLAAAALAVLISTIIAAKWPIFEAWQHYALTLLWVAAAATSAVVMLVRPLARSFTLAGIARVVEQRHPELHERISSTVELFHSEDSPEIRGSAALIHALATEASKDARSVLPRREITFRKARPFLIALAGTVAVIAALCFFSGGMRKEFAKRLLPFLNLPNLYAEDLRITPGEDRVLAEGERLEVKVAVERVKVRSAEFRVRQDDDSDEVIEMSRQADGSFAYTTPPLSESQRYRIRAGDAVSRYYDVTVVPRPAVVGVEVAYDYPDYLGRRDKPPTACSGRIRAPAGSVAAARLRLNKPVVEAELLVNNARAELTRLHPAGYSFVQELSRPGTGAWRLTLTDRHGYTGEATHEIIVTPDAAPTARILSPVQESLKLKPFDRLPIFYRVHDDHGLSRAELLVSVDGQARREIPIAAVNTPYTRPGHELVASETMLNLGQLDLTSARRVTLQVRAWDNLPEPLGGPQEGISAVKTIELDVKAQSYAYQVQLALDLRIRETLEAIYKELTQAKKLSEPLRRSMPNTKKLTDKTIAKLDTMGEHLMTAEADTRNLAEATAGSTYPKLSETLSKLADQHIATAREAAGLIKITDDQAERAKLANDEVDFQIDRALAIVSDLLKQFDVLTDLARRAIQLQELAERQQALAAAKMTPTSQPTTAPDAQDLARLLTPEEWQQAQDQVARDTAQEVRQTPNALHEALEDSGSETRDLAAMAERLRRQQQALMQHTTASERLRQMQQQLQQVAREQADLARQAAQLAQQARPVEPSTQPAGQAAGQAQAAAQALTTTQPASAIPAQAAAAQALDQTAAAAEGEVQRHAAAQLADLAERLARQQAELAGRSETAQQHEQAARAAQHAAAQHAARQQRSLGQVGGRVAALAARQAALAQQARQLEAAGDPPTAARPAQAMDQAARSLQQGDPAAAAAQAEQASGQARALDSELARRATAAEQAAQRAADQVQPAAQAAEQAEAQSGAAARQAQQAQAKAAKSDTPQDQQAAQGAQSRAEQAAQQAASAQKAAEAAAQQATQARQAQQQAAQRATQGGKVAAQQAQLAEEIRAAATREAPHLADAQLAAQQATAEKTRAARQTKQAAEAIRGAVETQKQLSQQVPQLKKLAERAPAQVQQAVRQHDPTANMKRAAGELARSRAARAAPAQRSAEAQLRRIADAARGRVPRTDAQRAAERLAAAAERMARQQDQLADQAAGAQHQQQAAQTAQRAAQQQQARQQQIQAQIAARSAGLARQQEALTHQAQQMESATKPQQQARPAKAMQQAADNLRQSNPAAAMAQAQQAAERAQRMAGELTRRAAAAQQAAKRAAQQPGQAARQVMAEAQQADRQAAAATEMARQQGELAGRIAEAAAREAAHVAQGAHAGRQAAAEQARAAGATQRAASQTQAAGQGQRQLAQQVPQLRQLARQATPAAQAAMRQHDPSANMQQAVRRLERGQPGQATPAQQAAARQLRQLARAARQDVGPPQPARAAQVAQTAGTLARQQRELQRRTADLTRQRARTEAQLDQQELTRLQAEQQQIAREAAELSDDVRQQAPQPDRIDVHAAQASAEASRRMAGRQLAAAAESGQRAAGMMNQMSRRLGQREQPGEQGQGGEESGEGAHEPGRGGQDSGEGGQDSGEGGSGQPSSGGQGRSAQQVQAAAPSAAQEPDQVAAEQGPTEVERRAELAGRAGELARRQQRVAAEAAALAARQRPQLMASRQQRIAEETGELQQGAELINDHIGDLLPDPTARQLSQATANALRRAAAAQASAQQALSAGRPGQSMPSQQGSASALGQAAQSLRRLGQYFAEHARRAEQPPPQGQDALPGQLADAYEATRSAAQSQAEADAAAAARLLAALAARAGRQAMAMGVIPFAGMPMQSPEGFTMASNARVGAAWPDLTAAQLEKLGITLEDWARLPGELRDEVLQSARLGGPEEYRTLIKRYFQAIAKLGAQKESLPEKPKK